MDERRKIEEPVSAEFERFNKDFEASLRSETTRLQSAIDVILNSTGKHVRPLLVLLTAKVCGQVTDNTITFLETAVLSILGMHIDDGFGFQFEQIRLIASGF